MKTKIMLIVCLFPFIMNSCSNAQSELKVAFPSLSFTRPLDLEYPGDRTNRLFVVEQSGVIWVFQNDSNVTQKNIFLDIQDRVNDSGNEQGLLGLAFHPDYENNGYFYVNYTASNPNRTEISRFSVSAPNPDSADKNSEFHILSYNQPYSNHNGGKVAFGPADGYLYIGVGDGGSGGDPQCNAQNLLTLLGSILRIDVNTSVGSQHYGIPPDNPFAGNAQGYREEIYAYGLRNPWRFSFDPVTNWLWVGDVGQNTYEEVDVVSKGGNYGWNIFEGFHCYTNAPSCQTQSCSDTTGLKMPIWEYTHSVGISITGGYVYRGPGVPELNGKYIYADYGSGRIWSLEYDGVNPATNTLLMDTNLLISSFGADQNQELYICAFDGKIYRFKPTSVTGTRKSSLELPETFELGQNFPNPFNPDTTIPFQVKVPGMVEIQIFDINGKHIKTLINEKKDYGDYQVVWDGTDESGHLQPSGVYFYKMTMDNEFSENKRMALVK
jgi:glucose/arabinose dehydrogenase